MFVSSGYAGTRHVLRRLTNYSHGFMKRRLPNFCPPLAAFFVLMLVVPPISAQHAGRLITAEATTLLPVVEANDNLTPAGKVGSDGTLNVALEVVWSDFRLETPDRPGLRLLAIGEVGERPSIPAPLFRMQARTRVRVSVRNTLSDSSLTVFGFQERPVVAVDSLVIPPGEVVVHEFSAGVPGTYLYWMRIGAGFDFETDEREQLAGAFVVDDEELSVPDRILVMNIFSTPVDPAVLDGLYYEALTINGKSWPFTERLRPNVGEQQLWRIVNASNRNHPMHLHGFFYDIASMGDTYSVEHFPVEDQKTVVTQFMTPRTTMDMVWTPTRPGKWLFHCHLSFHVNKNLRLTLFTAAKTGI
jgi:FtsP/CotA-like multicopper oxidase with cupredoxin domain